MDTVALVPTTDQWRSDQKAQHEFIVSMLEKGDEEARAHRYHEATLSYYNIFQPSIFGSSPIGLRRVVPLEHYYVAASRLRITATKCAVQLIEQGSFLPDESPAGVIGLPRGALNQYLISNQYDVFTECALQFAVENFSKRDVKRFLVSSVRARLNNLRDVRDCAPLLAEEAEAFDKLAAFEARLNTLLVSLHRPLSFSYPNPVVKHGSIAAS